MASKKQVSKLVLTKTSASTLKKGPPMTASKSGSSFGKSAASPIATKAAATRAARALSTSRSKGTGSGRGIQAASLTPTPTIVRFFLADDVRQEINGKVSAVGLYPDNVVIAEMSGGTSAPSPTNLGFLPAISVLANVTIEPGEHRYQMTIDPTSVMPKVLTGPGSTLVTPKYGDSVNLIMRLPSLPFTGYGMVHVVLTTDTDRHVFSFEIRRKRDEQFVLAG